ncbi:WD40 repeat-like protein [Gigaspora margarita]|uniref:DNA damage-binding protein CMR1 n=2 Tax=Gigaspora margarita TaxID=4874 RepID=A0A8H3X1N1_GIGMA|nr:WD40 repeat-like protein [Gigaspora margarita]
MKNTKKTTRRKIGEDSTLNEYERQRLENIRRNEEVLRQLDIPEIVRSINLKKLKQKRVYKVQWPSEPTRHSLRIRGFTPDGAVAKREAEKKEERREREKRVRLKADLVKSELMSIDGVDDDNDFVDLLSKMTKSSDNENIISDETDYSCIPGGVNGFKAVQRIYSSLGIATEWSTVNVTPDRIYCIAVHPSKEKVLVAAGDKNGCLGFWDVRENIKSEYDEDQPRTYAFQAHTRTITSAMYSPTDSNHLYTCSYDGSIRSFDFNQAKFMDTFIYGEDDDDSEYFLSSMDMDPNGQRIYFSTNHGHFGIKDIREPAEKFTEYKLHEDKIGCISINKIHPQYLVTSSRDRTMRLWDIRKLNSEPEIQQFKYKAAVTSAYWSPNGNQVVSTCFDHILRVFDFNEECDLKLRHQIPHNNKTGRQGGWVTMFRATWHPNPNVHPHFIIGDMLKAAEIFSGIDGELIWTLRDEGLKAIPAVNAFHPNLNLIVGGTASGKMCAWEEMPKSPPLEGIKSMPRPVVVINNYSH